MVSAYIEHMCTPGSGEFASITEAVRRVPMIIDSSRYWEVFSVYREYFGKARVKVIWFDDYTTRTEAAFQDVCRFLGINSDVRPNIHTQKRNSRLEAPGRLAKLNRRHVVIDDEWEPRTTEYVVGLIRDDYQRFLTYFGRPVDFWSELTCP